MRILVLGGTQFVGLHFVEAAVAGGHDVTLFHRGQTGASLFPELRHILGDREHDLGLLDGMTFDAVVDTSAYVPRVARLSCDALAGSGRYLFVSTISTYAEEATRFDEDAPLGTLDDPGTEEVTELYGELKAACEGVVRDAFGERAVVVRPGLIVGPHDPTNRFAYWVRRIDEGGDVLAPAPADRLVQFVDARDLAAFLVGALERELAGTFNVTGDPVAFGAFLDVCIEASGSGARIVWADDALLLEEGVAPYRELPFWLPEGEDPHGRLGGVPNAKARAAGLTLRPFAETVADTLEWVRSAPPPTGSPVAPPGGLSRERERELLAKAALR